MTNDIKYAQNTQKVCILADTITVYCHSLLDVYYKNLLVKMVNFHCLGPWACTICDYLKYTPKNFTLIH